jgi:hypothetical protein
VGSRDQGSVRAVILSGVEGYVRRILDTGYWMHEGRGTRDELGAGIRDQGSGIRGIGVLGKEVEKSRLEPAKILRRRQSLRRTRILDAG